MKKITWNWGTGIVLFIIGFVLMNLVFGFIAMNTKVDLVRTDYYESELLYQQVIDKKKNYKNLTVPPTADIAQNIFRFDYTGNTKNISGTVHFYRPSDSNLDQKYSFSLPGIESTSIKIGKLKKGFWKADIEFTDGETSYFMQKEFYSVD